MTNYENPVFYRIEEDLYNPSFREDQIKQFKRADVKVTHNAVGKHGTPHYYAVLEGESQDSAKRINRENNRYTTERKRAAQKITEYETESYQVMVDNGYDAPSEGDSIEDILCYKALLEALAKVYDGLDADQRKLCDTVKEGLSQRAAAEKLGMPRSTYRDALMDLLAEMREMLKEYR